MKVKFLTEQVSPTPEIRDNFKRLADALDQEPILRGNFKFFEIEVADAVTGFDYPHNLSFQPTDVILMTVTNGQTVTFHHDYFTNINIKFTTSGACTLRCYIGSYAIVN